jgi:putative transposase
VSQCSLATTKSSSKAPRDPKRVRAGTNNGRSAPCERRALQSDQRTLPLVSGWGGRRSGAGRKPATTRRLVLHRARPMHRSEHPVHVTLRSVCRSLRTQFLFPTIRNAISAANRRLSERFRVAEFSVQGDHVHLIVEAGDKSALVEGVRGLCIRMARAANQLVRRRGRFFVGRWHGRALITPRAVRHALIYVLGNFGKHGRAGASPLDVYSSAPYFQQFREFPGRAPLDHCPGLVPRALAPPPSSPVALARSWLLATGWKRHGKISIFDRPKGHAL